MSDFSTEARERARERRARADERLEWHAKQGSVMAHLGLGIFLTLFGVLLTLDALELVDLSSALRLWPLGFLLFGATILVRRSDSHGRFWGGFWIVVGVWSLVNSLGLASIGFWELFWPAVMVLIGVRLILRARHGDTTWPFRTPTSATTTAGEHQPNLIAVMSESKGSVTQTLAGASLTSVMGGCHLDLRQATVAPGTIPVIDVFSLMGGQEITVPSGWTVVFDLVSIMAGSDDKRLPAIGGPVDGGPPQIIIRGITIFSGLTVKN
jgi:hypothetical protein